MTTKTFILEPCSLDVSTAEAYGRRVYLFDRHERRSSIWSEDFRHEILKALEAKQFDPDTDYFVVAGHLVPIIIALSVMQSKYGKVKTLMFSATDRRYIPYDLGDYDAEGSPGALCGNAVGLHEGTCCGVATGR